MDTKEMNLYRQNNNEEEGKFFIRFIKEKHLLEKVLLKLKSQRDIKNADELIRYLTFKTQTENSFLIDALPTINEPFLFADSKLQEYIKWIKIAIDYKTTLFTYRIGRCFNNAIIQQLNMFNHEL